MSFSEWTKNRKKNQPSVTGAGAGTQETAPASRTIARDDTPSSFGEWTRKNQGETLWRDEELGFDTWMNNLQGFSQRVSEDYAGREGKYQSADSMTDYLDKTNRNIDSFTRTADDYRNYFTAYRDMYDELYGAGTTERIFSTLDEGKSYLESVRGNLYSEAAFWSQFSDEDDYNTYRRGQEYAALADAEDFAEKSKYVSTYKPGTEKFNAWSGTYSNTGFGDIAYDYINKDETAVNRQMLSDIQSNASLLGLDNSERGEMTDDEIAIFNYIYATESPDAAYAYIDYLTADLNYRERVRAEQDWAEYAAEHPVGSSVFSVLESPLKGLSYLGQFADYAADGEIDQNEAYNKFSYINSAIRTEVGGIVEENWGGVGSFAYNTGMSMGDFLFSTAVSGGNSALTLGILGSGAAADTTIAAKDRGLSDGQAFALGTIAGAAEVITEKISLDALLDKTSLSKSAMGYFLKNTIAEGGEEVGSDLINLMADILISKDKSEWQLSIDGYQADGMSEDEAFWHAVLDQAETMGLDFLGGAISGGVLSGGAIGINAAGNAINNQQTGAQFQEMGADVVQAVIQEGLASDPSTQSYQLAQQLQQKLDSGGSITNAELGRLYQANVQAIDAETSGEEMLAQAAQQVAAGGAVTNRMAAEILGNPTAINTLARDAGLSITEDMSRSRRRAAVKSAVEALASRDSATMEAGAETDTSAPSPAPVQQSAAAQRPSAAQAYDILRVRQAASSLGENGAKALASTYDGSVSADNFYAGFASYYEAGVSGMDMGKVRSEYADQLNEAQRFAAYSAGQNDAAASLAAERAAVSSATVYGDEAGFIQTEYSASLPKSEVAYYNNLARAVGVKIQMSAATGAGGANGWYAGGIIHIAADAENPGTVVAKHEITHRLQELAPAEYRKYRDYAVNALAEQGGGSASLVEQYKARYADSGVNLTTEQAMDEIAADFTEALTEDPSQFKRLAQENRTVAQKLLNAIRSFISKVKSVFKGKRAQNQAAADAFGVDLATLEEAAKLWSEALEAASRQVKSAGTVVGTEGGYAKVDGKFSFKGVVEDNGTLIALHNLNESKLLAALRLGGFPMPSIAVTRIDIPHTNFGDITLVMDRRSVDPRANRRNAVYSADAWTPTFPVVEYQADAAASSRITGRLNELSGRVDEMFRQDLYRVSYDMDDLLNRYGGEAGLVEHAMDNYGLKAAYLEEQGQHIAAVTTQREVDRGYSPERAEKYRAIAEALGTTDPETIGKMPFKQLRDEYGEALERAFPGMTKTAFRMSGILRQVQAFLEDQGGTPTYETVTDGAATRRAVDSALDRAGYERWVRDLYAGIQADSGIYNNKERFTPSGNRRSFQQTHYPVTLENIVKAMRGQNDGNSKNVSGFYGIKSLRAGLAERFKSVADMHRLEGRLKNLTEAEVRDINDALDRRLIDISEEIATKSPNGNGSTESVQTILMDISEGGAYTIDSIMRKYNEEYGYHITNEMAAKVRDLLFDVSQMPVNLFEAKPERVVGFNEVLAAVVPNDSSAELRDGLNRAGVRTLEYEAGNDSDRLEKVNSVEGARFSLKYDSVGHRLSDEQALFFENTKVLDENGNLLRVYHGSRSIAFSEFDLYEGVWLTPDRRYAEVYASDWHSWRDDYGDRVRDDLNGLEAEVYDDPDLRVYELYANITKPVELGELDAELTETVVRNLARALGVKYAELAELSRDYIGGDIYQLTRSHEFIELAKRMDFDGFFATESGRETFCAIYAPEQVKLVSNQNPTSDLDIRRSSKGGNILRENASLQEENRLLRERVEYWRGQTRRTERVTTDKKAVTRAARDLIRTYNADLNTEDISGDLQSLYDYIASGYDGSNELTYTEARRRAEEIARRLIDNAVAVDESYEQYSDLRSFLRDATIQISEEDSRNIADYGEWRKRQFGRMTVRKGPTNIDQVYQELSYMWPEFFDEQRITHPADQLLHIADVLNSLYNATEYNPFSQYGQQAVSGAANEIMETFFDLPQTRRTYADRQALRLQEAKAAGQQRAQRLREQQRARLEELRQQNRQKVQDAIAKERARRAEQIDRLKSQHRARDAAGRERRNARELRARIARHASALSQKLLRPSDKQHIPESLRQAVASMLDSINLESVYTVDPETGRRRKGGDGEPAKRTEAFRRLRLAYAEISKEGADYTLVIDPDLMDNLNELEAMRNTPIAEMGTEQLTVIWDTLKAVEASIRTANKTLGASRFETISAFADGIRSDNITRKDRGNYRGALGKIDKLVSLDMLTPQAYFHRLGNTGDELFRMMRTAQDRHITIMRQAQEATARVVGRANIRQLEREMHSFDLDSGKLTMSTAQIMGLYELMKREQAQEHILKGGIRPDATIGRGLRENRRSDPVHVTPEDLSTITGVLTEEQRAMADGLQKYMGGTLAELGNEASMEVYGYRKFTERNYYPIKVDRNQTRRDIAKEAQAQTIAGRGFTKGTTPKANNAVMVESIFDTYAAHVNDMATYAAWLPTMENIRRIRDFTFRDSEGNRVGDVKSIIERVFGKNGNAYLNKLVDDLNQGVRSSGTGNITDGLVGNYKAAAVAANIRVILQQPTAILRALNTLDTKYLLAGTVRRGDWAKVKKYAPIAVWKDWGYFDINTGRQMKDVLLNSDSIVEKAKQAAMAGAGKADSFAWARLWNAVEAETKDRRPGLKPGTDAFYRAVAERFGEIVDQTQVVDGLLQRSQIMRSPDALAKMSTSFMSEPTKTYNMFMSALYDLRNAEGRSGRSRARRAFARTSAALVTSFAVNAVMQSVVDALRDDDKERDYWEKFLTAYAGFTGDEENFLDYWNNFWDGNLEANFNPLGYLPYFKDIVSILQGYDVSRMDMEPISKLLEAVKNMKNAISGEGRYSLAGASANLLAEAARLLGIPVANLKRDIRAGIVTAAIETDNYLMQYRIDKSLYNMGYAGNSAGFYDILYNASIHDREAYEFIYADMVASGMDEAKIKTAMETRMKQDQGVESVADLEQRYLAPAQETAYASAYSRISGSSVWASANAEQRSAAEEDIYNLTVGNSDGERLREKIDGGAAYGIDETDYLLYRLAIRIADQPSESGKMGTYTGEEVQAAIDMLPGLDDEARSYLWEAAGKSESSNPYQ